MLRLLATERTGRTKGVLELFLTSVAGLGCVLNLLVFHAVFFGLASYLLLFLLVSWRLGNYLSQRNAFLTGVLVTIAASAVFFALGADFFVINTGVIITYVVIAASATMLMESKRFIVDEAFVFLQNVVRAWRGESNKQKVLFGATTVLAISLLIFTYVQHTVTGDDSPLALLGRAGSVGVVICVVGLGIYAYYSKSKELVFLLAIMVSVFVFFRLAVIYPNTYFGTDAWRNVALERAFATGHSVQATNIVTVIKNQPSKIVAAGYLGFVAAISRLTSISIFSLQRFTIPAIAALVLPGIFLALGEALSLSPVSKKLLGVAFLLSPMTISQGMLAYPQGLAIVLFAGMLLWLATFTQPKNIIKFAAALWVMALGIASTYIVVGLFACLFAAMVSAGLLLRRFLTLHLIKTFLALAAVLSGAVFIGLDMLRGISVHHIDLFSMVTKFSALVDISNPRQILMMLGLLGLIFVFVKSRSIPMLLVCFAGLSMFITVLYGSTLGASDLFAKRLSTSFEIVLAVFFFEGLLFVYTVLTKVLYRYVAVVLTFATVATGLYFSLTPPLSAATVGEPEFSLIHTIQSEAHGSYIVLTDETTAAAGNALAQNPRLNINFALYPDSPQYIYTSQLVQNPSEDTLVSVCRTSRVETVYVAATTIFPFTDGSNEQIQKNLPVEPADDGKFLVRYPCPTER